MLACPCAGDDSEETAPEYIDGTSCLVGEDEVDRHRGRGAIRMESGIGMCKGHEGTEDDEATHHHHHVVVYVILDDRIEIDNINTYQICRGGRRDIWFCS